MAIENTYIKMLIAALEKKISFLDEITAISKQQEQLLGDFSFKIEDFQETINQKEQLLAKLEEADQGFESLYEKVKDPLSNHKDRNKEEIIHMQKLIGQITDRSVKIQALEERNKQKLAQYFVEKRKSIKDFHQQSRMANNYYQNMNKLNQGDSYFLDKKK